MFDRSHAPPAQETTLTGPLQFPTAREIWQYPLLAEAQNGRLSAAKPLTKDEARQIAANIAKLPEGACVRFGRARIIVVMARRRNITPRFGIEDEILAAPIASISEITTKLEIITARAELFDVSDDLQRLHDQIAFRAGESLARSHGIGMPRNVEPS